MKIASTIHQIREAKHEARIGMATNKANNNGANTDANSNAAVAQSKVVKTDTVEVSKKSVTLAETTATKSEPKVEEATKQVTAKEKAKDVRRNARQAMRQSQHELKDLVKGLKEAGVKRREIGKIIKTANREANKTIGVEIRQAYKDLGSHKISRQSFKNELYGAAVKKLDSIVSALRDALAQKVAPADKNTEAVKERANVTKSTDAAGTTGETKVTSADDAAKANAEKNTKKVKEAANETKSDEATKATNETRVTDADDAAKANAKAAEKATKEAAKEVKTENRNIVKAEKEAAKAAEEATKAAAKEVKTENGNIVKAEKEAAKVAKDTAKNAAKANKEAAKVNGNSGSGNGNLGSILGSLNANEKADKAFSQIIDFFNNIDKMINGFADKAEGKGNDEDKSDSLLNFASRLSDMFSGINKTFGKQSREETLGHKLGMTQMNKETISQLFNNGHGSGGAIHRISDAGEGSGNFNAVSFMSSISNGINDALENYKDIQKAEKEAKEEAKEAVGVLA